MPPLDPSLGPPLALPSRHPAVHRLLIIHDILCVRFQWSASPPTSVSIILANIHGVTLLISRRAGCCRAYLPTPLRGRSWREAGQRRRSPSDYALSGSAGNGSDRVPLAGRVWKLQEASMMTVKRGGSDSLVSFRQFPRELPTEFTPIFNRPSRFTGLTSKIFREIYVRCELPPRIGNDPRRRSPTRGNNIEEFGFSDILTFPTIFHDTDDAEVEINASVSAEVRCVDEAKTQTRRG